MGFDMVQEWLQIYNPLGGLCWFLKQLEWFMSSMQFHCECQINALSKIYAVLGQFI